MTFWSVFPVTKLALAVADGGGEQAPISPFLGRLARRGRRRRSLDGRFAFVVVVLCCLTLGGCVGSQEYISAPDGSRVPVGCRGTGAPECEAGRRRAAHDLGCDGSRVSARFIDTVPSMVLASGCGQRALYINVQGEGLFLVSREPLGPPAR